jgi:SAM-dependent methyltransferase
MRRSNLSRINWSVSNPIVAMASQYDDIGAKYNVFKHFPTSVLETENFKDAVLPYLRKIERPRVLDLACGTGYYSHKLLDWGAAYVLGIDLSKAMVEAARQTITKEQQQAGVLRFQSGDALTLGKVHEEELFDIITGIWLLNYSSSTEDMTNMFRTISANLKEGGVFIGVTPHPTNDVTAYAKMMKERQGARWGVTVDYYEQLVSGQGWRTEVIGDGEPRVSFKNFHLRKGVYEEGAKAGGMTGMVQWQDIALPREATDRAAPGFWDTYYTDGPHMGVIVVEK